jgi:hypothetical protein
VAQYLHPRCSLLHAPLQERPAPEAHRELTPLGNLAILEEDKRYLAAQGERGVEGGRRTIVLDANALLDKNLVVFLQASAKGSGSFEAL